MTTAITDPFITTHITHRDCELCASCVQKAKDTARATGSIGGSYKDGAHEAAVRHYQHIDMTPKVTSELPTITIERHVLTGASADLIMASTILDDILAGKLDLTDEKVRTHIGTVAHLCDVSRKAIRKHIV